MFKKWFAKKESFYGDFAFLQIDMHSHLIPGIDDGSQSAEDSIRFIEALRSLGWRGFVTTPHILSDLYPNTPITIEKAYAPLKSLIKEEFLLEYAAEYMVDEYFEQIIKSEKPLTFNQNHVLIEMSYLAESRNLKDVIFSLRIKGFQPVLAHPERYNFYHRDLSVLADLKDMGCYFQLNLLSLSGYYGSSVQKVAMKLLAEKQYEFAGTDLHHDRHLAALQELTKHPIMQQLSIYPFLNRNIV